MDDSKGQVKTRERKVVHQLRRARRLADMFATAWPDPAEALATAQALTPDSWLVAADLAGITPPSPDTTALTIELLRERTET